MLYLFLHGGCLVLQKQTARLEIETVQREQMAKTTHGKNSLKYAAVIYDINQFLSFISG